MLLLLFSAWPNETEMSKPVEVKHCNVRSELVKKNWNSNKVRMDSSTMHLNTITIDKHLLPLRPAIRYVLL